jgi:hypothetical protein
MDSFFSMKKKIKRLTDRQFTMYHLAVLVVKQKSADDLHTHAQAGWGGDERIINKQDTTIVC